MWKSIYDELLQLLTDSWGKIMAQYKNDGRAARNSFQQLIYMESGLWMIGITFLFTFFYYYYLNARFGRYYSVKCWWAVLESSSLLVAMITYVRASAILREVDFDVSQHLLWLAIINYVYSSILFIVFSIAIKWWSPMGKRTPF